ncbi:CRISPR-associated endonuclease Cas1 [Aliarcobacter skirrowii]|uniref:CRISPR-associated endonuclease Cas1 n=1 Tax=Aliarcobacter skirrowii TaxID=28200 RepID=UPI000D61B5D5|nr:CRISPR-associated endonuclease Cas1 [Aliarcobacter skirrowii]PWE19402.1 CRISPR-associated endonuclease Cas1 [Aliarcobacter skirrowii]PWE25905.1 CRISPR-associated endonuclease Cas1 [Aliarcobacter skirrowii]RJO55290.1 CRISPR-associated endonuclease Cas1 [Aliarcobacter skirrowii]RJO57171.1 CRISPR-associated endonuclease Cas1 [Aliarcobacter skirrowii]
MKIAIIDKKNISLKIDTRSIKVDEKSIPFHLIDILLITTKTALNSLDILRLNQNGISILLLSQNSTNISIINSAKTKQGELKLAQYEALSKRIEIAKDILTSKVKLHKEHLEKYEIDLNIKLILKKIEKAQNIDELMGLEGSFAKTYFKEFFSLLPKNMHKNKRSKNPPQDPANAVLSLFYTLYYNIISIKLLTHGFEPSIGYLHTPFREHNALASDLMELFRADINEEVIQIFKENLLSLDDFTKKGGVYLKYEARSKIWKRFLELEARLKSKLDKEVANIRAKISKDILDEVA